MTPRRHGTVLGEDPGVARATEAARPRPAAAAACRIPVALAAAVLLALSTGPAAGADDEPGDRKPEKRPSLSLRASPAIAFSPARIVVTAELRGGSENDGDLYCPDVEWEWGDDTRSEAKQNCEPFVEGETTITRRWTASHTYTRAGRYQAFLRLKRGGKVIVAGNVKVDVRPGAGDLSDFDR